jgi:hypothetical protein
MGMHCADTQPAWSLSSEEIDNCLAQLSEQQADTEFSTDGFSQ